MFRKDTTHAKVYLVDTEEFNESHLSRIYTGKIETAYATH